MCVCVCERECYTYPLQQYFFPAAHVHFVVLKDWRPSLCIMATQKIEIPLAGINLKVFYKMLLKSKTKGVQKIPPPKNVDLGHVMILLLLFYLYTFVDVTASEYFSLSRASLREAFSLPSLMCASSSKGNSKQLRCNLKSDRCPIVCMILLLLFSNWMQMFQ